MPDRNTATPESDAPTGYRALARRHVSRERIVALFRPYSRHLAAVLGLIALTSIAGIATPFIIRRIIDDALPASDLWLLGELVAALVVIAAATATVGTLETLIASRIGQAIMHDLRVRVYVHLQRLSLSFFTDTRTGEIQSRIASDIGGLQSLVTRTGIELTREASVAIMTAVAMLMLDWRLALFSFAIVPALAWLQHRVGAMREAIAHEQQARIADMSSTIQESLSVPGIILARTTGRARHLTREFTRTSQDVGNLEVRSHTAGQWEWSLVYFALAVLPALTLLAGGALMRPGSAVTVGTLVAMITLQEQLLWPLSGVLQAGIEIRAARALFARIFEYLDKPAGIVEKHDAVTLDRNAMRGAVRLENVSFTYERSDAPALAGVSIDIPAGSHVAIVGPTGSGKTTLAWLLARLYDVDAGVITYDGIDIRDLSLETLTAMVGVVTQEPYLFNASLAANLRFARPDATDAELSAAVRAVQLGHVVDALPDGLQTTVGEAGYHFSGGEKQRIALARALLRNTPVLLLDEATSALDTRTERLLSDALGILAQHRTTITIAHRLSTVRNADQIVVLENGRIVEHGNHDTLMRRSGLYAELVASMNSA
ncbi:ABC transporter ATP-binding protein [Paraburkholderia sabiae]|uniref:ABC transporter ATP-binding protein n=1 Tax=Paraburkholderia sabiae TaxID=273251 RepID=A0ABU9QLZ4_9BURK|nr:ABC transporter ATP-binding protein [Paraburkholderia sabiae]WJZ77295.1 ABC transporter ATP-binding protein [Paraburkholderia sabiae]CAD6548086.1 putative ABC transporter ATP-binding protein [Paraburkholderia sabiae]